MRHFLAQDHLQNLDGGVVTDKPQTLDHCGRDVQTARLQHPRHQGHALQAGVGRLARGFPQSVVRGEISVGMAEIGETCRQQFEMSRFIDGDTEPVAVIVGRHAAESVDGIHRQIDRIEFDVRHRVHHRGAAGSTAEPA